MRLQSDAIDRAPEPPRSEKNHLDSTRKCKKRASPPCEGRNTRHARSSCFMGDGCPAFRVKSKDNLTEGLTVLSKENLTEGQ
jgi:hypothetical protein